MKNLDKILSEVSAEIAKGKGNKLGYVPRKIFNVQGNIVPFDKLGPEWQSVMREIIAELIKNPKIAEKFAPNTGDVDLHLGTVKNIVMLTADDGSRYKYNIKTKRIEAL